MQLGCVTFRPWQHALQVSGMFLVSSILPLLWSRVARPLALCGAVVLISLGAGTLTPAFSHEPLSDAPETMPGASMPSELPDEATGVGAPAAATALTDDELRLLQASAAKDASAGAASAPGMVQRALQSMNPDISLIFDGALAAFSNENNLQSGAHDPQKSGFNLQQLELHLASNVDPYLHFAANLVFSQFGVEVEEAYATTLQVPYGLQAKVGQFLTSMGRINPTHPHSWSFVDQPLVNGKFFGGEGSRGLGGEVNWLAPLPWYVQLKASLHNAEGDCCARSFLGAAQIPVRRPQDLLATIRAEQFFPLDDDWSLYWGLSTQLGPNATGADNRTDIYGTDLYVRYRPATDPLRRFVALQAEAFSRARQVPGALLRDHGGYAQLVWHFDLRWETGVRTEVGTGAKNDPTDPDWTGNRTRHSAQITFYPSHFSRVRLQGSVDNAAWRSEPVYAAFIAVETLIGEHGSHNF